MQNSTPRNFFSKKAKWKPIYIGLFSAMIATILLSNASGPAFNGNGGRTGAPGEGTCSNCHGGGSFNPNVNIQVFENGTSTPATSYVGGNTYDVRVTVSSTTGTPRFGFQLTALTPSNTVAGTFNSPSSNTRTVSTGGRNYIEQNARSLSGIFTAKWVAPASGSGLVTLYSSGNCVNANGGTSQDNATNTSISLPEFTIPLSASITRFIGSLQPDLKTKLQWETSAEQNNAYYTIQRSQDAIQFEEIGTIQSKANQGNSVQMLTYEFMDTKPFAGRNYYRLLQTDLDGKTTANNQLIEINNQVNSSIEVYPNPCTDFLTIRNMQSSTVQIRIVDMMGHLVKQVTLSPNENVTSVDVSNLPHGQYLLHIQQQDNRMETRSFLK